MPTVQPGSLVVITGITGYIASHIGIAALKSGFRVRGTVRSLEKANGLLEGYKKLGVDCVPEKLEFVEFSNLTSQEGYEKLLEGAEGVVHTALSDNMAQWIQDAIASNLALLKAAKKVGTIKRVVLTSSTAAVYTGPPLTDKVVDASFWNDEAVQKFQTGPQEEKFNWIYHTAKTLSEREAWKWIETEKPGFDMVTILPNINTGPLVFGQTKSTATFIMKAFNGENAALKRMGPQWYIDVRDCGALHIHALTDPESSNIRILAAAGPCGANQILSLLRKNFPDANLPADVGGPEGETSVQKMDTEKARSLLGGKWIGLEESLVDMAKSVGY